MKKFILFYRENALFHNWFIRQFIAAIRKWSFNSSFQKIKFNQKTIYHYSFLLLLFTQFSLYGQNPSADLDQVRNGSGTSPISPGNWVNGNAGASNAHYSEGWSIPYRMTVQNVAFDASAPYVASATHELIIEWDIKHSGKHAIDYITHYYNLDNPSGSHQGTFHHDEEIIDPTIGFAPGVIDNAFTMTYPIPAPSSAGSPVANMPTNSFNGLPPLDRVMTIYNGTITSLSYVSQGDLNAAQSATRLKITFIAHKSTVLFAWGGHIAAESDWGEGNGATGVSGSPYHTRLISLDGSGGNQDRSLQSTAVVIPPQCAVSGPSASCADGGPLMFNASITNPNGVSVTYSWSLINNSAGAVINGSTTGSSISVNLVGSGSFEAQVIVTRNGSSSSCSQVCTVNALPNVVADDAAVCSGFTVQLSASPAGGTWSGDHISASGLFDSSGLAPGDYNVTYTYTDGNQCTNNDGAVVTVNALPVLVCPDDSMDNQVQCGVSVSVAQATTDLNFSDWFNSFAVLNPNPNFQVINVDYVYSPLSAAPAVGHAPLNPTLGVPGSIETSVLVTWTIEDQNGCVSSCSATFALSYNCTIGCSNDVTPVLCYGASTGTITVNAQGGTPPYMVNLYRDGDPQSPYRVSGPLNTGAINFVFDNLPAGSYSYTVTDATNGDSCNNNEPIIITQPESALTSSISGVDILCYGDSNGSVDLSPSGGTPPYSYVWSASNGGIVPVGQENNQDLTGLIAGTYSVVITDANGDAGGCRDENSIVITQSPELSCSIVLNNDEMCADSSNGSATVNVTGGSGGNTYLWDNGETTQTAVELAGGLHSVIVTDSNGCSTSCEITISTIPCDDGHCTYTQGFYGNYNGLGCVHNLGLVNAQVMMTNALENVGGYYDFGSTITGNYFKLKMSDVTGAPIASQNNIFKMLPGGGTPRSLVGSATYDDYSTWSDNDPINASGSRKGKINNNLLSQTMTLFFNIQNDITLSGSHLEATFATAADIECGMNIPNMETVQVFNIPQSIIDYLDLNGGATIGNLFVLANRVLGGENINGVSPSNVNAAVDAINRGYDECRIGVPIPPVEEQSSELTSDVLVISSYPNPFREYIMLNYQFDYASNVEIQIFDTKGTLVYQYNDKDAYFGKEMKININFNHAGGEIYILKLITNKGVITNKMISGNR